MDRLVYNLFNTFMWLLIDADGRATAQIIFCLIAISSLLLLLKFKDDI